MNTEKNETRPRQPDARLNPLQLVDLVIGQASSLIQRDAEQLGAALIAYGIAATAEHPYADKILDQVIQKYASEAGIELPSEMKYDRLDHGRLLEPIGRASHPVYRQQLDERLASIAGQGNYGGQPQYGGRQ